MKEFKDRVFEKDLQEARMLFEMITFNNILDDETVNELVSLVDFEIQNFLCNTVPKYQSRSDMHMKYKSNVHFQKFFSVVEKILLEEINNNLQVSLCWFNVCKKDSKFAFHTHKESVVTAVFFLKNCKGNGTQIKFDNSVLQLMVKDNDLVFFNPDIMHRIPDYNGLDRYSIALDFVQR